MHEAGQNVAKIKSAHFQCQMHFQSQMFILCNSRIAYRSLRWVVICRLSKSDRQFICFRYPTIPYITPPIMFVKEIFFTRCFLWLLLVKNSFTYLLQIRMFNQNIAEINIYWEKRNLRQMICLSSEFDIFDNNFSKNACYLLHVAIRVH